MKVAYFVHELADAAVRRRLRMLAAGGCDVALLGFARDRGAGPEAASGVVLGHTANQQFVKRIFAVLGAIPRVFGAQKLWRDADLLLARNLEMLVLVVLAASLVRPRARIAYECLDIHRLMASSGAAGFLLRWIERACLRRTALVVTSSPAFERHHFLSRQGYRGDIVLAENKVLAFEPLPAMMAPPEGPPWTIAWCGMLRCRRSFEMLRALATGSDGRVRIALWGVPALDQIPDFHDAVASAPHMTYHGRYRPEELPRIYGGAHIAWAIDFYEAGANSDWLLPNRLYESLAFGAPPLAIADVETARWLERHDVGMILEAPYDQALNDLFGSLTASNYAALRVRVASLDPALTRDTPGACAAFAARLLGGAP